MMPSKGPTISGIKRTFGTKEKDLVRTRQGLIVNVVVALFDQDDLELRERIGQSASDDTSGRTT